MRALTFRVGMLAAGIAALTAQPAGTAAASAPLMLRAGSTAELISDINEANHSGQAAQIRVSTGTYLLTGAYASNYGPSALPVINVPITLIGASPTLTVLSNQGGDRTFTVTQTGQLTLENISVTGGVTFCTSDTSCVRQGGGILINFGTVTTNNVIFSHGASAPGEGGPGGAVNVGGGLLSYEGTMSLQNTTISDNFSFGEGGGLAIAGGTVTLNNCLVQDNNAESAFGEGGGDQGSGIYMTGGSLTIEHSTIRGNTAGLTDDAALVFGVGIYAQGGTILIEDSAVTENTVLNEGGNTAVGAGGGIYNGAHMTIINSTVGGNSAGTMGGGIFNGGTLTLQGVTITGNTSYNMNGDAMIGVRFPFDCDFFEKPQACIHGGAGLVNTGTVTMATSVIAGNNFIPADGDPQNIGTECAGVLQTNGHNALGDTTGCTLKASAALGSKPSDDLKNIVPKLGAFDDNGVAGFAHYPLETGSPLIGAGGTVGQFCTATDQIGESRAHNICAIGAIQ